MVSRLVLYNNTLIPFDEYERIMGVQLDENKEMEELATENDNVKKQRYAKKDNSSSIDTKESNKKGSENKAADKKNNIDDNFFDT
jgi:hypothetical protein